MANYDIPQYPTKRLRYFNNQFLTDQDFIDDDAAQIAHERAFLRSLCVAGVCEGLQVAYPAANLPPSVSAGIAIDKTGRMIVVDRATDALANPDALADGDYFIHISFLESEDAKSSGQGASDFTRWKQTPVINAIAKSAALPDGAVVLGSSTVKGGQFVGSGTTVGRQYSGLRLPGPNQGAAATLRNSGASDDLALLGGSLTLRRDAAGQIGPTLTLLNGAAAPGADGAIDFNGYDPGINDPTVRIRSLDDGNSSSHLTFATKPTGNPTNKLVERLRLTNNGLLQFPIDSGDKIVVKDNGTTDRYGIGLNDSNINLFCPTTASFSLRQNSSSGTEVFKVTGSGQVTFSGSIDTSLAIRRDVKDALGPTLKLLNGSAPSTAGGAGGAIDFNGYDPGTSDPSLRIQSLDDGKSSSHLTFSTKQSGAATNKLVERLRLTSDGLLKFPNEAPKDKIVLWDNGTSRFGIGINGGNLNLFYPTSSSFSLRQNSSSGTEVFSVDSSGNAKFYGAIIANSTVSIANNVVVSADLTAANLRLSSGGAPTVRMYYAPPPSGRVATIYSGLAVEQPGGTWFLTTGGWLSPSDAALKTDVVAHDPVLERVMKLRPVRFRWKADGSDGSGFIAQEVEALFPDLVHEGLADEAGRRMKSLSYDRFGMLAIAAIKELKTDHDARLDALERKLAAREGKS